MGISIPGVGEFAIEPAASGGGGGAGKGGGGDAAVCPRGRWVHVAFVFSNVAHTPDPKHDKDKGKGKDKGKDKGKGKKHGKEKEKGHGQGDGTPQKRKRLTCIIDGRAVGHIDHHDLQLPMRDIGEATGAGGGGKDPVAALGGPCCFHGTLQEVTTHTCLFVPTSSKPMPTACLSLRPGYL